MELILLSGPPGAGKSTLANLIAKKLNIFILDKDCIDESFSPGDRGANYSKKVEPKVLSAMLRLAKRNMELGTSVILDVPWTHIMINEPSWVEKIKALATSDNTRITIFELKIAEDLLRKRLEQRGLDRDQVKLSKEGWKTFSKTDCLGQLNPMPHHILDATQSSRSLLKKCLEILK
jgi:predicted kinase